MTFLKFLERIVVPTKSREPCYVTIFQYPTVLDL